MGDDKREKEGKKGVATGGKGKTDNDSASPREREEQRAAGVDRGG